MQDAGANADAGHAGTSWSVLELLILLANRWRFIAIFTLAVGLVAAIDTTFIPARYTAATSVLPPQPSQSLTGAALLSQMGNGGGLAALATSGLAAKNPSDIDIAIFRSHAVEDAVIRRFGLLAEYKAGTVSAARGAFEKHSTVVVGLKDGIIRVSVDDSSPQRAAALANGYVEEFRKLATRIGVTDAARRRAFFDGQLEAAKKSLASAEQAISPSGPSTGIVTGRVPSKADFLAPGTKEPATGVEYFREAREVKYREAIFELLAEQDELAKLDEGSQGAVFETLDAATPPETPTYPHRSMTVMLSAVLALLFACIAVWAVAGVQTLRSDPEEAPRLARLVSAFRLRRG